MRLDECLGKELGHVDLTSETMGIHEAINLEARSAGFPFDRSKKRLVVDPACRLRASWPGEWSHDCATLPGDSGGPIFREVKNGSNVRLEVFGLITCGEPWTDPVAYRDSYGNRAV